MPGHNIYHSSSPKLLKESPKFVLRTESVHSFWDWTLMQPLSVLISFQFLSFFQTEQKFPSFVCLLINTQLSCVPILLCQQENSPVLCLAWIITKLFVIRTWGCDLTAIFSFPFSVFNTFQKLKIPNLSFFFWCLSVMETLQNNQPNTYALFIYCLLWR